MLIDFSNKKRTRKMAIVICTILVLAMTIGLLVSSVY